MAASAAQIRDAAQMARDYPNASARDIAQATGVSQTTAARARAGELDHRLDVPPQTDSSHRASSSERAESVSASEPDTIPGLGPRADGPGPGARARRGTGFFGNAGGSRSTLKPRKSRRSHREFSPEQEESLYQLGCMIAGAALIMAPDHLRLSPVDQESIIRPLSRMYLRRQTVPVLSDDDRDKITLLIGVMGYGYHAFVARAPGRGAQRSPFPRGFNWGWPQPGAEGAHAPAAGPSSYPPQSAGVPGNGSAGAPTVSADLNPFDPQAVMDRLEEEIRRGAAERAAAEAAGVSEAAAPASPVGGSDA